MKRRAVLTLIVEDNPGSPCWDEEENGPIPEMTGVQVYEAIAAWVQSVEDDGLIEADSDPPGCFTIEFESLTLDKIPEPTP